MSNLVVGQIQGLSANGNVITVPAGHTLTQPGSILQVVQTLVDTQTTYSSISTYTDMTGFTISITPKFASSKILLRTVVHFGIGGTTTCNFRWVRGSTPIALGTTGASGQASFRGQTGNAAWATNVSSEFLDSPGTTSAITYKLQLQPYDTGRTVVINNAQAGGAGDNFRTISTITAMEIAQ